jgi:hypothetical protein
MSRTMQGDTVGRSHRSHTDWKQLDDLPMESPVQVLTNFPHASESSSLLNVQFTQLLITRGRSAVLIEDSAHVRYSEATV